MADARPYYADRGLAAEFYDLVTAQDRGVTGDVDTYARLAGEGAKVLELGSGTGRVSFGLASLGFDILGLELAPAMLVQAERRLEQVGPDIAGRMRFRRGDMAALNLGETFDAVIAPYYALNHLPAGAGWRNVFRGVAAHLNPGGIAAFHLHDEAPMLQPPPPRTQPVFQQPLGGGRTLRLYIHERRSRRDLGRHDQAVDYRVETADGRVERQSRERLTLYVSDPAPIAEAAGLVTEPAVATASGGLIHVFRKPRA